MLTAVRVGVIPAGGLGTRLLPVTKTVPKEMLPLVDVPVIERVIESLVDAGVEEVVVVSAPGKSALDAYFQPAPLLEKRLADEEREAELEATRRVARMARIRIVYQDEPLGNGDAVLRAREAVGQRPFVVVWPDDLVRAERSVAAQLVAARERLGGGSVAAVARVTPEEAKRYGLVDGERVDERTWRVKRVVEKPDRAFSDIAVVHGYVLEPEIFDALASLRPGRGGEIWLADAVNALAQQAPVYAYLFEGERFDAGDRAGYVQAVIAEALARTELRKELEPWLKGRLSQ